MNTQTTIQEQNSKRNYRKYQWCGVYIDEDGVCHYIPDGAVVKIEPDYQELKHDVLATIRKIIKYALPVLLVIETVVIICLAKHFAG